MGRLLDIVSPEGLRVDGRRSNELRRINCKIGVFREADGSAYLEQGNTKCLAAVYGPRESQKRNKALHDKASIKVEFSMATFSTGERKQHGKRDKKLNDMAISVQSVFESIIVTNLFPRSEIDIYIQILQTDGGVLHTAINAATLALIDAGIPMSDYVVACSAGYASDESILELNYIEESSNVPILTIALSPRTNKILMIESEKRLHRDDCEKVMELAMLGCKSTFEVLNTVVRQSTEKFVLNATLADLKSTFFDQDEEQQEQQNEGSKMELA